MSMKKPAQKECQRKAQWKWVFGVGHITNQYGECVGCCFLFSDFDVIIHDDIGWHTSFSFFASYTIFN